MFEQLYAVWDRLAGTYIGGIHLHRHDAAAVRMFGDVASDKRTMIGMHPQDFELRRLAFLNEDGSINSDGPTVVITGEAWLAAQQEPTTSSGPELVTETA